jgi:hypothetical protein
MRLPARTLVLDDAPEAWAALGFAVHDGRMALGDLCVRLGGGPALEVEGLALERPDGLALVAGGAAATVPPGEHPLGALSVDHVVAFTDDLDRTVAALCEAGLDLRRRGGPQAFFNLATTILELGEVTPDAAPPGPGPFTGRAWWWGVTIVVADLDAAAQRLGPLLGSPRDAVQPGRRIATLRREAGLSLPTALITPRVRTR